MTAFVVPRGTFESGLPDPYGNGVGIKVAAPPTSGGTVFLFVSVVAYLGWRHGSTAHGMVPVSTDRAAARRRWIERSTLLFVLGVVSFAFLAVSVVLLVLPILLLVGAVVCQVAGARYGVQANLTRDRSGVELTGLDDAQVAAWTALRLPA